MVLDRFTSNFITFNEEKCSLLVSGKKIFVSLGYQLIWESDFNTLLERYGSVTIHQRHLRALVIDILKTWYLLCIYERFYSF